MKKVASLLLSVLMIIGVMSPAFAFAAENEIGYNAPNGDFYRYVVLDDGTAEITYWKNKSNSTTLSVPSSINSYTVTSIGAMAFNLDGALISKLTIPNTIKSIGSNAFSRFSALTSIAIPNSVTYIGSSAFYYCPKVTSITIGTGVKTIEQSAFTSAGIKSLTIPGNVKTLGASCFAGCTKLTSLKLTNGVTTINDSAFMNTGLTSVSIPASVKKIGQNAFTSSYAKITTATIYSTSCTIDKTSFYSSKGVTVKGYYGSTAMKFCKTYSNLGYKFKAISLKGTTVNKLSSTKKKYMTVKVNKQSQCSGYQIQYSKSSGFKSGNKTATISGSSNLSKTVSGLTSGKKYYVRVRTYVNVAGSTTYSSWSKAKYIKVK